MYSIPDRQLDKWVRDECMLVAEGSGSEEQFSATIGIDLDLGEIGGFFLDPTCTGGSLGPRMVIAAEKLAVQFGILDLIISCPPPLTSLLQSCGYRRRPAPQTDEHDGNENYGRSMHRSFPRRQTRYSRRISNLLAQLGITPDYGRIHRIGLQQEAVRLHSIGCDIYGRNQQMFPAAAQAWQSMRQQAAGEGFELQAVSAFRSVDYQAGIVQRKLDKDLDLEEILAVSAAPGFSEHHTGRAIDITSPGFPVLEEKFEKSAAFEWLHLHAATFGFRMSFPRGNRHTVAGSACSEQGLPCLPCNHKHNKYVFRRYGIRGEG